MSEQLHAVTTGEGGPRVAFCHGLFGQGRNWTQIAAGLRDIARPTLLDMPNHGRSPWSAPFDYVAAADLVAGTLRSIGQDDPWVVVGHSMGGKIAMILTLRHPELVRGLCVVDVSPVAYTDGREFERFVAGMRAMDLDAITTRAEADAALSSAAPDPGVRGFLLQNLRREGDGWRWQMNLDVLGDALGDLRGWPADAVERRFWDGPVTWVAGETSGYVTEEMGPPMRRLFPRARLVTVKGAGHWVHAEEPEVVTSILRRLVTLRSGDGDSGAASARSDPPGS